MSDEYFMQLALAQARQAADLGEVPVGAVVVRHGEVIASGRNTPIDGHDPTAHAEIVALRAAAKILGNYRLDECELFVTLEPCAMCSGAMLNARIKRVVFGASEPKTGAAGSVINLFAQAQLNHQTQLQGGVLAEQCRDLMQVFFRQRRAVQREVTKKSHPLRDDALRTPESAFEGLAAYPWQPHYLSDLPALDGLRMHYLDEKGSAQEGGSAPLTYLCLHGNTTWSYEFRQLIPALLQAGHRVVAPDLIGFGKSDKPKKDSFHTFSRHRQILLELVESLDLKNIVLTLSARSGLLGLTLPMAAAERYLNFRLVNGQREGNEMAMSSGYLLWQVLCMDASDFEELPVKSPVHSQTSAQDREAYALPFPDNGHRAALRARASMRLEQETAAGIAIFAAAHQFWRERWTG
ncbi:MAG: tRNA adenosine(34) deaminase TadA [Polaromonas sp.]